MDEDVIILSPDSVVLDGTTIGIASGDIEA
jgi:hypothetical protein